MSTREFSMTPPIVPGGLPVFGHALSFYRDPVEFLLSSQRSMGDVFTIRVLGRKFTVLCGPDASRAVFHAGDETMSRRRVYRAMTPVFGKGILFDAAPERFDEQISLLLPALQENAVGCHIDAMLEEVNAYVSSWGDEGCIDLVEAMSTLSVFIAARCLIGPDFRARAGRDLARLMGDLKSATRLAWLIWPHLPLPAFRRRDRARRELITLILQTARSIRDDPEAAARNPLLSRLMSSTYSDGTRIPESEAASLLLAFVVGGEHNTAAMAAWTGALLLQDPVRVAQVVEEQARTVPSHGRLSARDLQGMNELRRCAMEAERLYPPLSALLRDVEKDFRYQDYVIRRGSRVMLSPAASHRLPNLFADPEKYDPDRFSPPRSEHESTPSPLMGFGGGKHRCTGFAFAYQEILVLWSVLFRTFELELADGPPRPDYTAVTTIPRRPCRLRYRRRDAMRSELMNSAGASLEEPGRK